MSEFAIKPIRQPRNRNMSITLSLNPEEKASIEKAAKELDCSTSEYLRAVHRAYCEYQLDLSQKAKSDEAK